MVLANKTKYADIAKQVDGLNKKKEKNKSSFFNKRIKANKKENNKETKQEMEQKKKEEEKNLKEKEQEKKEMEKQKEKEKQERLEAKRKAKEQKIKEREKQRAEREKERAKALEAKRKAKKERQKEKERLAKEREEQKRKEQEQREKERAKELELKIQAKQERIKEKERIEKEQEEQRKKMEEEKLKQAESERQAMEQKKIEEEKFLKERQAAREEMEKQKEKEKQERLEAKRKAKEQKIKEREKQRAEREKERAKALEAKRKAKKERQKEKERLAKEREEQKRKEQEQREKERAKELELKIQAKDAEKKEKERLAREREEKLKEQKQVYDQSKIEVVKTIDREIINLRDESELSKVIKETYDGDIVYERTGFGWKGIGSRRIIFDENLKQYVYEVVEPKLTPEEEEIKKRLVHLFRTRADIDVSHLRDKIKEDVLEKTLDAIREKYRINLEEKIKNRIYYYINQDFIGYGKIDIPMHDEGIEDISCDGCNIPIFIYHKKLESIRTNIVFKDPDELDSFVIKLSQMCGKQISVYEPVVDGKLEDGSRLQVTLGKTITKDSTFTIRRFRKDPLTPVDLIENNTMDIKMAAYFWLVIEKGASVLFCGGTASGKTTMLNALSLFLPDSYKIVSVEDTREINLPHENWIAGTTRTGFSSNEASKTGKDIDMFDLLRVALRQRPKAIIVGEVRGKEAYTLFQAMTTGHLSYSTVHASDMHSLIQRLESPPINLPRSLLTSLDMVVFLNSLTIDGKPVRRITNVTEIIKLDPETNRLVTVSPFYWISEIHDRFKDTGGSKILNKIKLENMWSDEKLEEELKLRKKVLKWMIKNKLRSYSEVGRIISEFYNNRKEILKKIEVSK